MASILDGDDAIDFSVEAEDDVTRMRKLAKSANQIADADQRHSIHTGSSPPFGYYAGSHNDSVSHDSASHDPANDDSDRLLASTPMFFAAMPSNESPWDSTRDPDIAHRKTIVGLNPYVPLFKDATVMEYPIYGQEPPLHRLQKPSQITFIQKLSSTEVHNRAVWKVSWHGNDASYNVAILKMYLDHDTGYESESAAYASPVPTVMPDFYGAYTFSSKDILEYNVPLDEPEEAVTRWPLPVLLFEFIEGEPPTPWNITPEIAKKALRSLEDLHHGGILHGDVVLRNMRISSDKERFVLIDFDCAEVYTDVEDWQKLYNSYPFLNERARMWSVLYRYLLPDRTRMDRGKEPYSYLTIF
ncbi:hypothetical protein C8J56DRAFT_1046004 [Mycena floridula]|nr:hypothetical protein C8J56DRAFT_1046004 [Mycena floridula]